MKKENLFSFHTTTSVLVVSCLLFYFFPLAICFPGATIIIQAFKASCCDDDLGDDPNRVIFAFPKVSRG